MIVEDLIEMLQRFEPQDDIICAEGREEFDIIGSQSNGKNILYLMKIYKHSGEE